MKKIITSCITISLICLTLTGCSGLNRSINYNGGNANGDFGGAINENPTERLIKTQGEITDR